MSADGSSAKGVKSGMSSEHSRRKALEALVAALAAKRGGLDSLTPSPGTVVGEKGMRRFHALPSGVRRPQRRPKLPHAASAAAVEEARARAAAKATAEAIARAKAATEERVKAIDAWENAVKDETAKFEAELKEKQVMFDEMEAKGWKEEVDGDDGGREGVEEDEQREEEYFWSLAGVGGGEEFRTLTKSGRLPLTLLAGSLLGADLRPRGLVGKAGEEAVCSVWIGICAGLTRAAADGSAPGLGVVCGVLCLVSAELACFGRCSSLGCATWLAKVAKKLSSKSIRSKKARASRGAELRASERVGIVAGWLQECQQRGSAANVAQNTTLSSPQAIDMLCTAAASHARRAFAWGLGAATRSDGTPTSPPTSGRIANLLLLALPLLVTHSNPQLAKSTIDDEVETRGDEEGGGGGGEEKGGSDGKVRDEVEFAKHALTAGSGTWEHVGVAIQCSNPLVIARLGATLWALEIALLAGGGHGELESVVRLANREVEPEARRSDASCGPAVARLWQLSLRNWVAHILPAQRRVWLHAAGYATTPTTPTLPLAPSIASALEGVAEGCEAESILGRGLLPLPLAPSWVLGMVVDVGRIRCEALADNIPGVEPRGMESAHAPGAAAEIAAARLVAWVVRGILLPLQRKGMPPTRGELMPIAASAAGACNRAAQHVPAGVAEAAREARQWTDAPIDAILSTGSSLSFSWPESEPEIPSTLLEHATKGIQLWPEIAKRACVPIDVVDDAADHSTHLLHHLHSTTSSLTLPSEANFNPSFLEEDDGASLIAAITSRTLNPSIPSPAWVVSPQAAQSLVLTGEDPFSRWPRAPPPPLPHPEGDDDDEEVEEGKGEM